MHAESLEEIQIALEVPEPTRKQKTILPLDRLSDLFRDHVVPYTKNQGKDICAMVMEWAAFHEETTFWEDGLANLFSGPCLLCRECIDYSGQSSTHRRYGDKHLKKLWGEPVGLEFRIGRGALISGVSKASWKPYVCGKCYRQAMNGLREFMAAHDKSQGVIGRLREERHGKEIERFNKWILEPSDGSPIEANMFQMNRVPAATIKAIPYKEFLLTRYWLAVRMTVLKIAHFKCSLCASKKALNVHHKTYQSHGSEASHLEDLAVLCYNCHAKFHDKIAVVIQ